MSYFKLTTDSPHRDHSTGLVWVRARRGPKKMWWVCIDDPRQIRKAPPAKATWIPISQRPQERWTRIANAFEFEHPRAILDALLRVGSHSRSRLEDVAEQVQHAPRYLRLVMRMAGAQLAGPEDRRFYFRWTQERDAMLRALRLDTPARRQHVLERGPIRPMVCH